MYLLDTNACIAYLRQRDANLIRRMNAHSPTDIALCSVVLGELYYGVAKSSSHTRAKNLATLQKFALTFVSFPFDDAAAEVFGQIRADLESKGLPIGSYDMQIAVIALNRQFTVVTHNTSESSRVSGLVIEDWQIP